MVQLLSADVVHSPGGSTDGVFSLSAGEVWTDKGYSYAWGYYIVLLWDVICAV